MPSSALESVKPSIDIVTTIVQDELVNETPVCRETKQLEMFFIVERQWTKKAPK